VPAESEDRTAHEIDKRGRTWTNTVRDVATALKVEPAEIVMKGEEL
jgi:hypothetical protein